MTCPRCQIEFNHESWGECPHCGEARSSVTSGVLKTSTILISSGREEQAGVYRSVEEVPEPLRQLLVQSTNGLNSGTIFIADQRGREEIARALRSLPQTSPRPVPALPAAPADAELAPVAAHAWRSPSALVFGAVLAAFAAAVGWLVLAHTW